MANIPTCDVLCTIRDNDGTPIAGATVTARLNGFDVYEGYVVPDTETGTTDANGQCTLALWPNELGATQSSYDIKIVAPNGKTLRTSATVPNVTHANLHEIASLPPYDGKSDGQLIIDAAVAAVAPAVAAKLAAETAAGNAATSASNASSSATAAAGSATTAAGHATAARGFANTASAQAGTATTQASIATTQAGIAATQAGNAAASAGAAETSAIAAAGSADTAATNAGEAEVSATAAAASQAAAENAEATAIEHSALAISAANAAASSKATAATQAAAAATSAGAAAASAVAANSSASGAASSATSANASAVAAASSASSSSAGATTATTKASEASASAATATSRASEASVSAANAASGASTATTQAGIATTKAGEAAASATTAATHAGTATTQAGVATTKAGEASTSATSAAGSAGTATTQAGIATTKAGEAASSAAAAAASYDAFDDRYLGPKAVEPALDNDGNVLAAGALYFNTTLGEMRVFNGANWQVSYAPSGTMPLVLPAATLLADTTIYASNMVVTPGTLSVSSGVTITVEADAQWVITGDGRSLLQFDAATGGWASAPGTIGKAVGDSDTQTLTNKTLDAPVINDPILDGGRITNCEIILPAAIWHSHTITSRVSIPENCNAVSIPPINVLSGGVVSVGVNSTWSFLNL